MEAGPYASTVIGKLCILFLDDYISDDSQVFEKDKSGLWGSLVAKTVKNPHAM